MIQDYSEVPVERRTYKVTFDSEETIGNVVSWNIAGSILVLHFADGSVLGRTGFIDFDIRVEDDD